MEAHDFSSQMVNSAIDIISPVLEEAVVLSGEYAKACGRTTILAKDMEYCMKYCAMNSVGKKIGTYFPDIYDEEESDDEEIEITEEGEDDMFEPYSGDDIRMKSITDAYDAWESWVPSNPAEQMIKNAIDSRDPLAPHEFATPDP